MFRKLFWISVFILFVLPWAWLPLGLNLYKEETDLPKWVKYVIKQIRK